MRRSLLIAALALLLVAAESRGSLIGTWESEQRSAGGIGQILEFQPGGTVSVTVAALVDATYRLDGKTLRVSTPDPTAAQTSVGTMEVEVTGDTMIQRTPDGRSVTMTRVPGTRSGNSPIIGKWSSPYPGTVQTALTEFTPNGDMLFRLPMATLEGRYTVQGNRLTMTTPKGTQMSEFEASDNVLLMRKADGVEYRYQRVQ